MTSAASQLDRSPTHTSRPPRRFDIQALRAVAVLAVVVNHLWPTRLAGGFFGVDVFFVISGFLITEQLLVELSATGGVRLGAFWRRRARRLLPASLAVGATISALTFLLMPRVVWAETFRQVIASATYVENWVLAANSTDYFRSAADASPSMHYWSLSVEEQFYLVWPVILVMVFFVVARRRRNPLSTVVVVVLTLTIIGFALSAGLSGLSPTSYFNTGLRAWEFGVGGVLAGLRVLRASSPLLPVRLAPFAAVAGWLILILSIVMIGSWLPVPGAIAAIPVAGGALVIAADLGRPRSRHPVVQAGTAVLDRVGASSYSIYLWHWPLIVFAPLAVGPLGAPQRLVILAASFVVGALSRRFIEDPPRRAALLAPDRPRRYLIFVAATAILVLVAVAGIVDVERSAALATSAPSTGCFGAQAMAPGAHCTDTHRIADPDAALAASNDLGNPLTDGSGCIQDRDVAAVMTCEFGADAALATTTVALVGDSHAGHWIEAVDVVARSRGWRVVLYLKSSCPAVLNPTVVPDWYTAGAESCHSWSVAVNKRIAEDPSISTVLFSSLSRHYLERNRVGAEVALSAAAYRASWVPWLTAGKRVIVLADLPEWNLGNVPECVERVGFDDPCSVPAAARGGDPMVAAAAAPSAGLSLVDLNDFLCDHSRCHPVVGGLVVIGDANHMTSTFSRTLGPYLREALERDVR
ncbi:MAG: acyltransferase family protein [Pseudolysinimonas sp.]